MKSRKLILLTLAFGLFAIMNCSAIDVVIDKLNPYKDIQIQYNFEGIQYRPQCHAIGEFTDNERPNHSTHSNNMDLLDISIFLINPKTGLKTLLVRKTYNPNKELLPVETHSEETFLLGNNYLKIAYEIKVEFTREDGQEIVKSIVTNILKASMNGMGLN